MRTEKGLDSIVVPFYRLHILALTRVYHPRKFSSSLSDSLCTFVASSHPSNLPLFLVSPVIPTRKAHAGRTSTFITTSNLLARKVYVVPASYSNNYIAFDDHTVVSCQFFISTRDCDLGLDSIKWRDIVILCWWPCVIRQLCISVYIIHTSTSFCY